jgi:hypothetical protein
LVPGLPPSPIPGPLEGHPIFGAPRSGSPAFSVPGLLVSKIRGMFPFLLLNPPSAKRVSPRLFHWSLTYSPGWVGVPLAAVSKSTVMRLHGPGDPQPERGMQEPLAGLHSLQVSHVLALPPSQIPLEHCDPRMHKLPLLHGLPFCFLSAEHFPVWALQVLQAPHFLEVPPLHFPSQH